MTVLQAISLAGGVTERGSGRRLRVTRVVDGERKDFDAKPTDLVQPGDTITVRQRLVVKLLFLNPDRPAWGRRSGALELLAGAARARTRPGR